MLNPFVESLLQLAASSQMHEENHRIMSERIRQSSAGMTADPRQAGEGNAGMLHHACTLLLNEVENRYGDGAQAKVSLHPSFQDHPNSLIGPLASDKETFGLTIGRSANTWEDVFYEIAHEMVHLLNPVAEVWTRRIATLEEGVAVKFAEDAYRQCISAYTKKGPRLSPTAWPDDQYLPAFQATRKIPDPVLKQVREAFGSFWAVDDLARFEALTSDYLSLDDANRLVAAFRYPPLGESQA